VNDKANAENGNVPNAIKFNVPATIAFHTISASTLPHTMAIEHGNESIKNV
jgi:hypothetical protein